MDENAIKNEINKLIKKKKLINKLLFPVYILWCFVTSFSFEYVQVLIMIISKMFNLDNFLIFAINKLNVFVSLFSSYILYVGGKIESKKISKEIEILNSKYQLILDKNRKINDDSEYWTKDKNEVIKLYDIVEKFDKLPRDKQMEILNYIKGDLSLKDKYTHLGIDKLSNKYKEHLQTECEDILFPNFNEENNYTKKKIK